MTWPTCASLRLPRFPGRQRVPGGNRAPRPERRRAQSVSDQGPDHAFMREALAKAEKGIYRTWPNPSVGAVVADGVIIGRGTTARPGGPHAEVTALKEAGDRARGATLYVTLELCITTAVRRPAWMQSSLRHRPGGGRRWRPPSPGGRRGWRGFEGRALPSPLGSKKTPPELLNAGFLSSSAGASRSWAAARRLPRWAHGHGQRGKPMDYGGRGPAGRAALAGPSPVLSGVGTVLADDPRLTLRPEALSELDDTDRAALAGRPHYRLVLDRQLRTPPTAQLFSSPGVVLFHGPEADSVPAKGAEDAGATLVALADLRLRHPLTPWAPGAPPGTWATCCSSAVRPLPRRPFRRTPWTRCFVPSAP